METTKEEVFNVVKLQVVKDKLKGVKIEEFKKVEEAEEYLDRLNIFRSNELFEIRKTTKEIKNDTPKIGFFKRMKLVAEIEEEIKQFEKNEVNKETVIHRLKQFADFLK